MTEPRGAQRRMTKSARRAQILDAARAVFLAQGPQGARVRDIAEAAGINEALIYQHFRSKDELFDAAVLFPLERLVRRLHGAADGLTLEEDTQMPRVLTRAFIEDLLAALEESIPLFGVVLFSDRDAGAVFYQERVVPFIDVVASAVRHFETRWEHRAFEARRVTLAVWGMCWSLAMDAHFRSSPLDVEAAAREITDLVFAGLFPIDPVDP